eukprot:9982831-Alexandrium_andersonii.AAC.1
MIRRRWRCRCGGVAGWARPQRRCSRTRARFRAGCCRRLWQVPHCARAVAALGGLRPTWRRPRAALAR